MPAGQIARAQDGLGAGPIGVEHEGDVAGEAHHESDLGIGEGGPHGSDHVLHARLYESEDIRIALHHHYFISLGDGPPSLVQTVEQMTLLVERTLRRVHVLRGFFPESPPSEPKDSPSMVDQREHESPSKPVVGLARLADQQTGVLEFPVREAFFRGPAVQTSPLVRSKTHAERVADFLLQPPLLQVFSGAPAAFRLP